MNGAGNTQVAQTRTAVAERGRRTQVNGDGDGDGEGKGQLRNADEVARAVWKFFGAAGGCVEQMVGKGVKEGEDEVRLLRMRMRRSEVVVVPGMSSELCSYDNGSWLTDADPKFLLVVIHDTPPA